MAGNSTKSRKSSKSATSGMTPVDTRKDTRPKKPYRDFPLNFHPTGRFSKKIRGNVHYFGRWGRKRGDSIIPVDNLEEVTQAAVDLYNAQRDDLQAGRKPRDPNETGLAMMDLCNQYLTAKKRLVESGELTRRTFSEYFKACDRALQSFGKNRLVTDLTSTDFEKLRGELAETRGPVSLGNDIQRVRMIFKWAYDESKIDRPIRYGQSFNKPSARVIRKKRAESGPKMFEADELRLMFAAMTGEPVTTYRTEGKGGKRLEATLPVRHQLRSMVLLSLNCGFGQTDLARLPFSAIDLENGWVTFPRPKTGIERRAKLWPETIEAIQKAIAIRPTAKNSDHDELVFLTIRGRPCVRLAAGDDPNKWTSRTDLIGKNFGKLMKELGINGKRGFYALRHTFQTIAEECRDLPAVQHVMGHSDDSMSASYRERITDERLEVVADTVREWLFAPTVAGKK